MAPTTTRRQTRRHAERARLAEVPAGELSAPAEQGPCEANRQSSDNQEEDQAPSAQQPTVREADVHSKASEVKEAKQEEEEEEDKEEKEEQEEDEDEMAAENDVDEGRLLLTDYEKQREQRLKENAAKLASLNLTSLASSLKPSTGSQRRRQSSSLQKAADDDYVPSSSSDSEDSDKADAHDDPDYEDAGPQVRQAITLSLGTNANATTNTKDRVSRTRKEKQAVDRKGSAKKKRKGMQEQFTTEQIAAIFAAIDVQRTGQFSAAELERVVRSHDFKWSKQEIADMVDVFDSNKDGQLDLTEFQSMFGRLNMLRMDTT